MKKESLKALTLSLTDRCNFHCTYCYQQNYAVHQSLDRTTIARALDFFFPFLEKDAYILFYGGEPLLNWDDIVYTVDFLRQKAGRRRKKFRYSITTNGSLITPGILDFFAQNQFLVTLSFDGTAQDLLRGKGSYDRSIEIIKKILDLPEIGIETNSVFTPETVNHLFPSMQTIIALGVPNAMISLSFIKPWDENALALLSDQVQDLTLFLHDFWKKTGRVPVANFQGSSGKKIFACSAGKDRLALTADARVWGCSLFHDFFKEKQADEDYSRFCFGSLKDFMNNYRSRYREILQNYIYLRQDYFHTEETFCRECPDLHHCHVCPITSALAGSVLLEKVPLTICRVQRIFSKAGRELQQLSS